MSPPAGQAGLAERYGLTGVVDEDGGNLYLINGNMTKLKDAGIFAGDGKEEETP